MSHETNGKADSNVTRWKGKIGHEGYLELRPAQISAQLI